MVDDSGSESQRYRSMGVAALVALIVCWGFVPVLLRDLADSIDLWTANGIRYPMSAIFFWPVLWRAFRKRDAAGKRKLNAGLLRACLLPAIFSTIGQVFWAMSHYYLQASQIGFLVRASTIVAIVGSMILFADERRLLRHGRFYLGVALALGGFIALGWVSGKSVDGASVEGMAIMFLCSLFFGSYIVSVRKCVPDVDPILAFAVVAQMCSAVLFVAMLGKGNYGVMASLSVREWGLIIASSILGIGMGHVLMYVAVVRLGASVTTTCQSAMPFVTAAIASVVLGERLTGPQWASGIVIVMGALTLLSVKNSLDLPAAK